MLYTLNNDVHECRNVNFNLGRIFFKFRPNFSLVDVHHMTDRWQLRHVSKLSLPCKKYGMFSYTSAFPADLHACK